jgi:cytochrome c
LLRDDLAVCIFGFDKAQKWKKQMNRISILVGLAVSILPNSAFAEGDPLLGKDVFKKCVACHSAVEEVKKVGPHLVQVVGRKAAAVEGFVYSEAMKAKGAEGLVWDEANLAAYLKKPKEFLAGTKMAFSGLKEDADIANLIAYLKADPKP